MMAPLLFTRCMPAVSSGASGPLCVAATGRRRMGEMPEHGRRSQARSVPSPYRHPQRIRVPCGDHRPGVHPPDERPSASAATARRRRIMARSRKPLGGRDVRSGQERLGVPEGAPLAGPEAVRTSRERCRRPEPAPATRCPPSRRPPACGWAMRIGDETKLETAQGPNISLGEYFC